MNKLGITLVISCALSISARAATIEVDALVLGDELGVAVPTGQGLGIVVLDVADDGFGGPTATSFSSGVDDLVLGSFDLTGGTVEAGHFQQLISGITYANGRGSGDDVILYWFPHLSTSATQPGFSEEFGAVRNPDWVLPPAENDTVGLGFDSIGQVIPAFLQTEPIPEPTSALLVGLGMLSFAIIRRRS